MPITTGMTIAKVVCQFSEIFQMAIQAKIVRNVWYQSPTIVAAKRITASAILSAKIFFFFIMYKILVFTHFIPNKAYILDKKSQAYPHRQEGLVWNPKGITYKAKRICPPLQRRGYSPA